MRSGRPPLRSVVTEPLRHGRRLLAGDAGHVVPPTGAKGLNLAVSDVHYLADALVDAPAGSTTAVDAYSDWPLARAWKGRSLLVQPAGQVGGEHRGQHVGGQPSTTAACSR